MTMLSIYNQIGDEWYMMCMVLVSKYEQAVSELPQEECCSRCNECTIHVLCGKPSPSRRGGGEERGRGYRVSEGMMMASSTFRSTTSLVRLIKRRIWGWGYECGLLN